MQQWEDWEFSDTEESTVRKYNESSYTGSGYDDDDISDDYDDYDYYCNDHDVYDASDSDLFFGGYTYWKRCLVVRWMCEDTLHMLCSHIST